MKACTDKLKLKLAVSKTLELHLAVQNQAANLESHSDAEQELLHSQIQSTPEPGVNAAPV